MGRKIIEKIVISHPEIKYEELKTYHIGSLERYRISLIETAEQKNSIALILEPGGEAIAHYTAMAAPMNILLEYYETQNMVGSAIRNGLDWARAIHNTWEILSTRVEIIPSKEMPGQTLEITAETPDDLYTVFSTMWKDK